MPHRFPFLGARRDHDLDLWQLIVGFTAEPSPAQRAAIERVIPAGLRVHWKRWAMRVLPDDAELGVPEAWLLAIDRELPIRVAYCDSFENDDRSAWAIWSVQQVGALLAGLEPELERIDVGTDADLVSLLIEALVAEQPTTALPPGIAAWWSAGDPAIAALVDEDPAALRRALADGAFARRALARLATRVDPGDRAHTALLFAIADRLLGCATLPARILAALAAEIARRAPDADSALVKAIIDRLETEILVDPTVGDEIAMLGYTAIVDRRYAESQRLFDVAMVSDRLMKLAYANALWVIQRDNTGFTAPDAMVRRFLDRSLAHGRANPTVFYNAACVYMELADHEAALGCLAMAVRAGIERPLRMRHDPIFAPIAHRPGFVDLFRGAARSPRHPRSRRALARARGRLARRLALPPRAAGSGIEDIEQYERQHDCSLPDDYVALMTLSDGLSWRRCHLVRLAALPAPSRFWILDGTPEWWARQFRDAWSIRLGCFEPTGETICLVIRPHGVAYGVDGARHSYPGLIDLLESLAAPTPS